LRVGEWVCWARMDETRPVAESRGRHHSMGIQDDR